MEMEEMLKKALAIKNGQVAEADSLIRLIRSAQLESLGIGEDRMDEAIETLFPEIKKAG